MNRSLHFGLCILCALPIATYADSKGSDWKLISQWDNDLLSGTDRGYTNGSRIAIIHDLDPDQETHNKLQKALYRISGVGSNSPWGDERRFLGEDTLRFSWGMGLTQLMYTPDDYTASTAPDGERPYAGWLGVEFSLNVSDRSSVGGVTLSIGTTGKYSYAHEAQDWVHDKISSSPLYQGWDSQVPGELTLNLHLDRKEKIKQLNIANDWPIEIDGYYEWGAAIGNFRTDAYIGALTRFGYNLTNTYATPRVQLGSYGHALFEPESSEAPPFSINGFAGIRGTAVAYDITLDGPLFRDFDTGVDRKPLVGEFIIGLSSRIGSVDFSLSQTYRSDEFKGQSKNQRFGSVMIRMDFPF